MAHHNTGPPEPRRGRGRAYGGGKDGAPGESKPVRTEQRSRGTNGTMARRKLCGGMGREMEGAQERGLGGCGTGGRGGSGGGTVRTEGERRRDTGSFRCYKTCCQRLGPFPLRLS
jgi:hypothetical protein